jgi:2-methylcitrate dehydratase
VLPARVKVRPDGHLSARYPKKINARITIRTKEQGVFAKERNDYKSGLTSPLTWDRNVEKFCRLTEAFTDQDLWGRLIDPIQLYSSKISSLMDMLAQVRSIAVSPLTHPGSEDRVGFVIRTQVCSSDLFWR